jgi:hypothetical protein
VRRHGQARFVLLTLLLLLSLTSIHTLGIMTPASCPSCPADCPMHHARKLGCHNAAGVQNRQAAGRAPGLHCASCKGTPDSFMLSDQPALLPATLDWGCAAPQAWDFAEPVVPPLDVALDPPFHPPDIRSTSI